jgi:hypothetical protein
MVELTAKRWKLLKVAGILTILLGVVLLVAGMGEASMAAEGDAASPLLTAGMLAGLVGVALWLTARVLAWWHHG